MTKLSSLIWSSVLIFHTSYYWYHYGANSLKNEIYFFETKCIEMFKNCSSMRKMKEICSTNTHRTLGEKWNCISAVQGCGGTMWLPDGETQRLSWCDLFIRDWAKSGKETSRKAERILRKRILYLFQTGTSFEYCTYLIYT